MFCICSNSFWKENRSREYTQYIYGMEYGILNERRKKKQVLQIASFSHFFTFFPVSVVDIEHRDGEIPFFQSSHFYSTLLFVWYVSPVMYFNRHKSPILILIQTPTTYGYEMNSFFQEEIFTCLKIRFPKCICMFVCMDVYGWSSEAELH